MYNKANKKILRINIFMPFNILYNSHPSYRFSPKTASVDFSLPMYEFSDEQSSYVTRLSMSYILLSWKKFLNFYYVTIYCTTLLLR